MRNARIHPIDKKVGERLKELRKRSGLSQTKLGGVLGISAQQIQKYEDGTNRISSGRLVLAAKALSVPLEYFFDGLVEPNVHDGDALDGNALGIFVTHPEAVELCRTFLRLKNQRDRDLILELVRRLFARVDGTTTAGN